MSRALWSRTLARINGQLDGAYELRDRLADGRQGGAWTVRDVDGTTRVLTWTVNAGLARRREQTFRLVQTLIGRGYPTPPWHHTGTFEDGLSFMISDFVPGRTATWTDSPLGEVIAAIELQANVAEPSADTWSGYTRASLAMGSDPRRAVAELGSAAAQFLEDVDDSIPDPATVPLPESDAVHGDLEPGNILIRGDTQAIAVIDIDACGPGTRALAYAWRRDAWTHHASLATRDTLREHGEAVAGPEGLRHLCGPRLYRAGGLRSQPGRPTTGTHRRRATDPAGAWTSLVGHLAQGP